MKPDWSAYYEFCTVRQLERLKVDPKRAALFEDIDRNLIVPHARGMTTVLVTPPPGEAPEREAWETSDGSEPHVDYVTDNLAEFLSRAIDRGP